MWEFICGVLVGLFIYKWWTYPRAKSVLPGLNKHVFLDHQEDVELYYNTLSSCSQKVRTCLAEANVKYRPVHKVLPSSGSWETKTGEYLTINPAGTVPVLVHKGHPVYESHEQIKYIEQNLLPEDVSLSPKDKELYDEMLRVIDDTSMIFTDVNEVKNNTATFLRRRVGNCLGPMTFPLFCANITLHFSFMQVLEYVYMIPFVSDLKMIVMTVVFWTYGPQGFSKFAILGKMAGEVHSALNYHLEKLEQLLKKYDGPYIFGEEYTLADIGYVPIFHRMHLARWWPSFEGKYPLVDQYWKNIQSRPGYIASKPDQDMDRKLSACGRLIDDWKNQVPVITAIYKP